jgi:hypothetical protein
MGNFYADEFVKVMAAVYGQAGISLLAFNTRCHDCIAEGYGSSGEFKYVGGSVADFLTCIPDIQGAVTFVGAELSKVVLQGYSLGCDRIVTYMSRTNTSYPSVLLSPCDSFEIQRKWLADQGRTVEGQLTTLSTAILSDEIVLTNPAEYGVRLNGELYLNPVTPVALRSIVGGPAFRNFRLDLSPPFHINARAFAYFGGKDPLQTSPSEQFLRYLRDSFLAVESLVLPDGDHSFSGYEVRVASSIAEWIAKVA